MLLRKISAGAMSLVLVFSLSLGAHAEAVFTDIENSPYEENILSLYQQGLIHGMGDGTFAPAQEVTYAQLTTLLVQSFNLDLSRFRFIKMPVASDYYKHIEDEAWYSEALMVAAVNGYAFDADILANEVVSKEVAYYMLVKGIQDQVGTVEDLILSEKAAQGDRNLAYQASYQRALEYGIVEEQADLSQVITRGDLAQVLDRSLDYIEQQDPAQVAEEQFQAYLTVDKDKETTFFFDIYNQGSEAVQATYSSSQRFDFKVYDEQDELVYTWSSNRMFMMMIGEVTYEAGDYEQYEVSWDERDAAGEALAAGTYRVVFESNFGVNGEGTSVEASTSLTIE